MYLVFHSKRRERDRRPYMGNNAQMPMYKGFAKPFREVRFTLGTTMVS